MEYLKFLYKPPPSLEINLSTKEHNKFKYVTKDNKIKEYPTFYDKISKMASREAAVPKEIGRKQCRMNRNERRTETERTLEG